MYICEKKGCLVTHRLRGGIFVIFIFPPVYSFPSFLFSAQLLTKRASRYPLTHQQTHDRHRIAACLLCDNAEAIALLRNKCILLPGASLAKHIKNKHTSIFIYLNILSIQSHRQNSPHFPTLPFMTRFSDGHAARRRCMRGGDEGHTGEPRGCELHKEKSPNKKPSRGPTTSATYGPSAFIAGGGCICVSTGIIHTHIHVPTSPQHHPSRTNP